MSDSSPLVAQLIDAFRHGDLDAGNELLKRYRPWLRLLARLQLDSRLARRLDESDIVQQSMLAAFRDFGQFRGSTEAELTAWLRSILAHAIAHELRRHRGAARRDMGREVSIEQQLEDSSHRIQAILVTSEPSPSDQAAQHEQAVQLADLLEGLPADYREVLILRNIQGLSHEQVARRLDRSVGATRMLWVRALARLRQQLPE